MTVDSKRKALGRGLAALIPTARAPVGPSPVGSPGGTTVGGAEKGLRMVAIEDIHPWRDQPRKVFDDQKLEELADSLRTQGIVQPLVVRVRPAGGFELIAGERRWRAAQKAGLHEVPAVIRDIAPDSAFEMSLVENVQREDLNPIEEAEAYQRLIAEHAYTQETLAARVGKDRTTIANALRLLKLPEGVRGFVMAGRLSMGHARALLGLEDGATIERIARRVMAREMSVRQVEALVRREREPRPDAAAEHSDRPTASARDLGERLSRHLGTRVRVVEDSPQAGRIEIRYGSLDQLDALLRALLPDGS